MGILRLNTFIKQQLTMPKIEVYFSPISGNLLYKKNYSFLSNVLDGKVCAHASHISSQFFGKKVSYESIDLGSLSKEERDRIYEEAKVREFPLLFVDGKFIGVSCVGQQCILNVVVTEHGNNRGFD